jgi:hypothetical protein
LTTVRSCAIRISRRQRAQPGEADNPWGHDAHVWLYLALIAGLLADLGIVIAANVRMRQVRAELRAAMDDLHATLSRPQEPEWSASRSR